MLIILRAGIYTTVQDLGREGFRRTGISTGGALDQPALKIANLLVGNAPEAAGLEITLGQFSAEFTRPGWIALTGAGCDAQLDGKPLWTGWRYPVKKGQRLALGTPKRGMRSYGDLGRHRRAGNAGLVQHRHESRLWRPRRP